MAIQISFRRLESIRDAAKLPPEGTDAFGRGSTLKMDKMKPHTIHFLNERAFVLFYINIFIVEFFSKRQIFKADFPAIR